MHKGNNSYLIKRCMQNRSNWKELSDTKSHLFHFKWRHVSTTRDFSILSRVESQPQVYNHCEYHSVISNKLNLFLNLMKICEVNTFLFKFNDLF